MRTKEEILKNYKYPGERVQTEISLDRIAETLLDIRDLLANIPELPRVPYTEEQLKQLKDIKQ